HADPAQDPPPMLMALGAEVVAASAAGERTIALDDLFVDVFTTSLRSDEVLTAIRVPALAPGTHATYLKFLPQTADDYATVSVAATMRFTDDGEVADVRVALGACGPTPLRARSVEDALAGAVPAAARCVPGVAAVTPSGTGKYKGSLLVQLGPVRLVLDGDVALTATDEAAGKASVRADAKDSRLGGTVRATMDLALVDKGEDTEL